MSDSFDSSLRLALKAPGRLAVQSNGKTQPPRYVSVFSHAKFHDTPFPWEAMSFTTMDEVAKWVSDQGAAVLPDLTAFTPSAIYSEDYDEIPHIGQKMPNPSKVFGSPENLRVAFLAMLETRLDALHRVKPIRKPGSEASSAA